MTNPTPSEIIRQAMNNPRNFNFDDVADAVLAALTDAGHVIARRGHDGCPNCPGDGSTWVDQLPCPGVLIEAT